MNFTRLVITGTMALSLTMTPMMVLAADSTESNATQTQAMTATDARLVDNVIVYYNGTQIKSNQPAAMADGRILLPMRDFFDGIGMTVGWDEQTRVATIVKEGKTIVIRTESGRVFVNNAEVKLDTPPQLINNRVYVPLRFLSETLDCQVDYLQSEQHHTVRISGQEPEMTLIEDGTVTRIKNRTIAVTELDGANQAANFAQWREHHQDYFVDSDGYLNQVDTVADQLQIQRLDPPNATVQNQRTSLPFQYPAINDIKRIDRNSFDIGLSTAKADSRYVGVGQPSSDRMLAQFESKIGRLNLYDGQTNDSVINVSSKSGVINGLFENNTRGYVLDTIECNIPTTDSSYAIAANGVYGILIGSHFLIIDPIKGELIFEEEVSQGLTQGRVDYLGDRFLVSGVESSAISSAGGFYTATYDTDGVRQAFYASQTASLTNYDYMNVLDSYTENGRLYALLETRYDNYLLVYDTADQNATVKELPYQYDQFVPSPTGMKLFMRHVDYFYLQDV